MTKSWESNFITKNDNSENGGIFFHLFLIFVFFWCGYGAYRFPTTRHIVNQCVRVVSNKFQSSDFKHPQTETSKKLDDTPKLLEKSAEPIISRNNISANTPSNPRIPIVYETTYDHLKLGIPGKADTIIDRPGYALGYIDYHEQPSWVVYRLTKNQALTKVAKRRNNFREDPEIPTGSATLADYRHSGYDRGHLAPAADMAYSFRTMSDSFYMSNMSPQRPKFNRGIWKDLETQVRSFAISEQDIYVVTGPILPKTKNLTIGHNRVTIPTHFYKVVYDRTPPEKMIGFILPNEGSDRPLQDFAVTVDAVEAATGLDFFSTIHQPIQEQMESTIMVKDWKWNKE